MKKLWISFFILCICSLGYSQTSKLLLNWIDSNDLKNHIQVLSSDSLNGRFTGTIGQKKAAKYIINQFSEDKIKPYLNTFLDTFTLHKYSWGEIYLETEKEKLVNGNDISYLGYYDQSEDKDLEVVFGGTATDEQLEKINVKNRMVLVFTENMRKTYYLNEKLRKKGAHGVILANPDNSKNFDAIRRSLGNFVIKPRLKLTKLPNFDNDFQFFVISNTKVRSIMGKSIFRLNQYITDNNIEDCPTSTIHLKTERIYEKVTTENVVGFIPGNSDKCIIVSAHYDHLGGNGHNYYPGADDNASGTAAIMELAETFAQSSNLSYSMVFLAATGEEIGFLGTRHFVKKYDFDSTRVLVNLNLDMISRGDKKSKEYIYVLGTNLYPQFNHYLTQADNNYQNCTFDYRYNKKNNISMIYRSSDQYIFHENGIPAIMFFSGLHEDYHTPADTAEKIDFSNLENRVKLIGYFIQQLQNPTTE